MQAWLCSSTPVSQSPERLPSRKPSHAKTLTCGSDSEQEPVLCCSGCVLTWPTCPHSGCLGPIAALSWSLQIQGLLVPYPSFKITSLNIGYSNFRSQTCLHCGILDSRSCSFRFATQVSRPSSAKPLKVSDGHSNTQTETGLF